MIDEIKRLRRKQADRAVKKVGPLLDARDLLPNDVKSDPELKQVLKHMEALDRAMED